MAEKLKKGLIPGSETQFSLPSRTEILRDYRIGHESRQISLMGRKEVLTGKAKFGIFGDGKEVPQLAMSHYFKEGDWRSGYYRDQTFMLAAGMMTLEEFFAQLYGDTDRKASPGSGGRMMNNHFSTQLLDENGEWKDLTKQKKHLSRYFTNCRTNASFARTCTGIKIIQEQS